jgi:hypothetical protein
MSISDDGYFEHIWWWLFWAYLMMVILSISDDGYYEHIWWRLFWAYLMKVILSISDDGYFDHIWWWLFWPYLMMVILTISDDGYSRNSSCALNLISTFLFDNQILRLQFYFMQWLVFKKKGGQANYFFAKFKLCQLDTVNYTAIK